MTVSSLQFQTNSAAFLSAVQEIAGQDTGLNVIDKATQVWACCRHLCCDPLKNTSVVLIWRAAAAGSEHSEGLQCAQRHLRYAAGWLKSWSCQHRREHASMCTCLMPGWCRAQEEASKGGQGGTLSDLSAYLLLTQAKDKYGEHQAGQWSVAISHCALVCLLRKCGVQGLTTSRRAFRPKRLARLQTCLHAST